MVRVLERGGLVVWWVYWLAGLLIRWGREVRDWRVSHVGIPISPSWVSGFEIAEGMVIARTRSIISPIRPGQKNSMLIEAETIPSHITHTRALELIPDIPQSTFPLLAPLPSIPRPRFQRPHLVAQSPHLLPPHLSILQIHIPHRHRFHFTS